MEQHQKLTKKEKKELKKLEYQEQFKKEEKQKLFKQIGIWAGVAAVIVLSILGLIKLANTTPSSSDTLANVPPINEKDITTGNKNARLDARQAKVKLIEYADFQCPACAYYHPIVKQILQDFNGKVLFAYRFFPLTAAHKNAMPSAQAAYAAYLQGKFWEMHDMIFEAQKDWAESSDADKTFLSYAEKLKLDINRYEKDFNADATKNVINSQADEGIKIGVNSTPTFFLNGKQIKPKGYDEFKALIQNELK